MKMKIITEIIIATFLWLIVGALFQNQDQLKINDGKGWDGKYYYENAEQIKDGDFPIVGNLPFIKRIGPAFIIAKISDYSNKSILASAQLFNLSSAYLTVLLLLIWFRFFIHKPWIRITLLIVYIAAWNNPLRSSIYEPMATDASGAVFFILALILLNKIYTARLNKKPFKLQIILFSIVVATGTLFRESVSILSIAIFFNQNPISKYRPREFKFSLIIESVKIFLNNIKNKENIILFLPLALLITTSILLSQYIIEAVHLNNYGYLKTIIECFYLKSPIEFATGVLIAYGPLFLLIVSIPTRVKILMKQREDLFIVLLSAIFFGYFAGNDTERIFYMSSFPIILVLIAYAIEELIFRKKSWWLLIILFIQTFALRIYWYHPSCPNNFEKLPTPFFTLIGDEFQYLLLFSHYGNRYLNTIIFLQYSLLLVISLWVYKKE